MFTLTLETALFQEQLVVKVFNDGVNGFTRAQVFLNDQELHAPVAMDLEYHD